MPNENSVHFEIGPTGACEVSTTRRPVNLTAALRTLAKDTGYLTPPLQTDTHLFFSNDNRYLMKVLSNNPVQFPIDMGVDIDTSETLDEPVFYPSCLNPDESDGGHKLSNFSFRAWPNMILLYLLSSRSADRSYLFAMDRRTGCLYHPPLPNLHTDGLICMGAVSSRMALDLPLLDMLNQVHDRWVQGGWNGDLAENIMTPYMFLRFRESTNENYIPENVEWTELCHKIAPAEATVIDACEAIWSTYLKENTNV